MPSTAADLHQAIRARSVDGVKKALRSGADINAAIRGTTPLSLAVYLGYEDIVDLLLSYYVNVNQVSKDHNDRFEPPLFSACRLGMGEIAHKLIKASADVNKTDYYNQSPLWIATRERRLDLVKLLLDHGAKLSMSWSWSECPLYLATKYLGYSGRRDIAKLLIVSGIPVDVCDNKGRNALYWSVLNCDKHMVQLLVAASGQLERYKCLQKDQLPKDFQQDQAFCDWLHQELTSPTSLRRICRSVIRRQLTVSSNVSILKRLQMLPVPEIVKKYLALEYLD